MKCPNDGSQLQMTARESIEIDYCPDCRGVWLDRGELDKLIEKSSAQAAPTMREHEVPGYDQRPTSPIRRDSYDHRPETYDERDFGDKRYGHKKKRKESFMSDLFDF